MNSTDFVELKSKIDKLKQQLHRAQGSRDTLLRRLKDEFECNGVEEGEVKLKELQTKSKKLTKLYDSKLAEFEEKWAKKLENVNE